MQIVGRGVRISNANGGKDFFQTHLPQLPNSIPRPLSMRFRSRPQQNPSSSSVSAVLLYQRHHRPHGVIQPDHVVLGSHLLQTAYKGRAPSLR